MRKFTAKELEQFLLAIDGLLTKKVEVIIIGGTAAALAYKVSMATQDIDTWNSIKGLESAYKKAKEQTQLDIPMGRVSVGDAPYNFEDRLVQFKPKKFKKLKILMPDVVDLILMKTLRGYEHDLKAIASMVQKNKVKPKVLIDRYLTELSAAIGDKRKRDLNFIAVIEKCFGKKAANGLNDALKVS